MAMSGSQSGYSRVCRAVDFSFPSLGGDEPSSKYREEHDDAIEALGYRQEEVEEGKYGEAACSAEEVEDGFEDEYYTAEDGYDEDEEKYEDEDEDEYEDDDSEAIYDDAFYDDEGVFIQGWTERFRTKYESSQTYLNASPEEQWIIDAPTSQALERGLRLWRPPFLSTVQRPYQQPPKARHDAYRYARNFRPLKSRLSRVETPSVSHLYPDDLDALEYEDPAHTSEWWYSTPYQRNAESIEPLETAATKNFSAQLTTPEKYRTLKTSNDPSDSLVIVPPSSLSACPIVPSIAHGFRGRSTDLATGCQEDDNSKNPMDLTDPISGCLVVHPVLRSNPLPDLGQNLALDKLETSTNLTRTLNLDSHNVLFAPVISQNFQLKDRKASLRSKLPLVYTTLAGTKLSDGFAFWRYLDMPRILRTPAEHVTAFVPAGGIESASIAFGGCSEAKTDAFRFLELLEICEAFASRGGQGVSFSWMAFTPMLEKHANQLTAEILPLVEPKHRIFFGFHEWKGGLRIVVLLKYNFAQKRLYLRLLQSEGIGHGESDEAGLPMLTR